MNRPWVSILQALARLCNDEEHARVLSVRVIPNPSAGSHKKRQVILAEEISKLSAEYDQEIAGSIERWKLGEKLEDISAHARAWRYVRLNTVLTYVSYMEVPFDSCFVISHPNVSDEAAIKWLLTEWWDMRGIMFKASLKEENEG
jgi:hypothetical protein